MEKQKSKKGISLFTTDEFLMSVLEEFKNNQKLYLRILEFLQLAGNFEGKTEINLYDISNTDEEQSIKIWLSDIEGNIFVLTPSSTIRSDTTIVEKLTNSSNIKYDLALAKKFKLTQDNIDLLRSGLTYNFKFGRLITNADDFYSLFLGNNICYQIQLNKSTSNSIDTNSLLFELNKLETMPTFKDYIEIFGHTLNELEIEYDTMLLSSYNNFECLGTFSLTHEMTSGKILSNRKDNL